MFPLTIVCVLSFSVYSFSYFISTASISPDGRTLLSVGDSNKVYFHRITGGAQVTFSPITTLVIPPPDSSPLGGYLTSSLAASFSAAFSSDGSKFAVASQEGVVAVWDVRGTSKPIKVFQTDKTRVPGGSTSEFIGNGGATGWLSDDPWEWTIRGNKAPGWCVRNVKFNGGDGARLGKEIMAFTEVSFQFLAFVYLYKSRHPFIAYVIHTYC
jgi:WD40 repeat protein